MQRQGGGTHENKDLLLQLDSKLTMFGYKKLVGTDRKTGVCAYVIYSSPSLSLCVPTCLCLLCRQHNLDNDKLEGDIKGGWWRRRRREEKIVKLSGVKGALWPENFTELNRVIHTNHIPHVLLSAKIIFNRIIILSCRSFLQE